MAQIALIGGSFNPPHLAHQMICLWLLSTEQSDQVWLVPCFQHPFSKELVDFQHRYNMCRHLVEIFPSEKIQVSDVEAHLPHPNRTLFTIRCLMDKYPEHVFSLVIGADILLEKDKWYQFEEIERLCNIIVVGRKGYQAPLNDVVLPPISSSKIREQIANNQDVSSIVPAPVLRYIRQHHLYLTNANE